MLQFYRGNWKFDLNDTMYSNTFISIRSCFSWWGWGWVWECSPMGGALAFKDGYDAYSQTLKVKFMFLDLILRYTLNNHIQTMVINLFPKLRLTGFLY